MKATCYSLIFGSLLAASPLAAQESADPFRGKAVVVIFENGSKLRPAENVRVGNIGKQEVLIIPRQEPGGPEYDAWVPLTGVSRIDVFNSVAEARTVYPVPPTASPRPSRRSQPSIFQDPEFLELEGTHDRLIEEMRQMLPDLKRQAEREGEASGEADPNQADPPDGSDRFHDLMKELGDIAELQRKLLESRGFPFPESDAIPREPQGNR